MYTPNRTDVFYSYLRGRGIAIDHAAWKNDATDSSEYKGLKIMLPNPSEEWFTFSAFLERYYGLPESENCLQFENARELGDWLEDFDSEDLFPTYQLLPLEVQTILRDFKDDFTYENCSKLQQDLEQFGLICDYELSAEQFGLKFKNE